MKRKCCSQNRCAQIDCVPCSRRYSNRLARSILATKPRQLFTIEFEVSSSSLANFLGWRTQIRNLIDYRRRVDRWWHSVELHVWLSGFPDGRVRGVLALDAVTEVEFLSALNSRWPTTLHRIGSADLRDAIYSAVRPEIIAQCGPRQARYQFRKLTILARRKRPAVIRNPTVPDLISSIEPMPVLM